MDTMADLWKNIKKLKDYEITYFLYLEGKNIETISSIRRLSKEEVENHLIKAKINLYSPNDDILLKVISMNKNNRVDYLSKLKDTDKKFLVEEIYKRYFSFKNAEDRMILIWLIGELKDTKLLPFLRMELRSNNTNFRRLSCSALGKIKNLQTKSWLEEMLKDKNPQVRQYSIKALSNIGDNDTLIKLNNMKTKSNEKKYVLKSIDEAIIKIKKRINEYKF